MYKFVDSDLFFTLHVDTPNPHALCSYWQLAGIRDSGYVVRREDVEKYLHEEVYLPYLLAVRSRRSDLLQGFLNEEELCWLNERLDEAEVAGQRDKEWEALEELVKQPSPTRAQPPIQHES